MGTGTMPAAVQQGDAITIGEALETTAMTAGEKPVEQSDAAAIQAAEVRATRTNEVPPGGVSAQAQSAATANTRVMREEDKVKLRDVLSVSIPFIDHGIPARFKFFYPQEGVIYSMNAMIGCDDKASSGQGGDSGRRGSGGGGGDAEQPGHGDASGRRGGERGRGGSAQSGSAVLGRKRRGWLFDLW